MVHLVRFVGCEGAACHKKQPIAAALSRRSAVILPIINPPQNAPFITRAKSALIRANRDVCTCEECESTHKPEIHHRDADYRHNEADNLQVLCRECHLSTHGTV